jgi:beta-lactamase superfamily II metal-dependent hydrolase
MVVMLLATPQRPGAAARTTLDFYFIDVEGGQSTLIVTPAGESLLVDTGFATPDHRDAARIVAAARDAGLTRIDYLLITHFHPDHDAGVVELSRQIPIKTFLDHGDLERTAQAPPASWRSAYDAYVAVRAKGAHVEPKPGERLPLKGIDLVWISSAAKTIVTPVSGAGQKNSACQSAAPPAGEPLENPRSTGFHLRFGKFRFIDVGDLSGDPLFALVCPSSLVGPVDLYLVPHHGGGDVSYPATFAAVTPRAVIVNNGSAKGGSKDVFDAIRRVTGADNGWQLHRSQLEGVQNLPDSQIVNLDESTGNWIKASAGEDGSFTVTNGRTGVTKRYRAAVSGTTRPIAFAVAK